MIVKLALFFQRVIIVHSFAYMCVYMCVIDFDEHQRIGFSFLVTDGLHQTTAEWFSVERDKNKHVELDANVQLNAAPGVVTPIGPDFLRARVLDVSLLLPVDRQQ